MSSRVGNIKVKCKTCGKEFLAWQYVIDQGRAKFCSKECYYESLKVLRISNLPEYKRCSRCGQTKPLSEFHKKSGVKSTGVNSMCKKCNIEHAKKYYYEHQEEVSKKNCEHSKNNPQIAKRAHEKRIKRLRSEAIQFFGPCECCGEDRWEFLSIDHINGHGNEQRKRGRHKDGWELLNDFHCMGWPEEIKKSYRLLCMNCNFAIGHHGYCPHHPEKKYPFYNSKTRRWENQDDNE